MLSHHRRGGVACAAIFIMLLMLPSAGIPSAMQASAALQQATLNALSALTPPPREYPELADHVVEMFNTTVTVIDENTVRVSIDYRFEWLNSSRPCDELYVYVDGAYGITMEDGKGPLEYGTNFGVNNGWVLVHLREEVFAGQSYCFRVSYYADDRITSSLVGQQKQYNLRMWAVVESVKKEDVAIRVNIPAWLSVTSYDHSLLKAEAAQDGGTVLTARVQNVSYNVNYYLDVGLAAKLDTSGWKYVPSVVVSNWTSGIMAGVPTDLVLAVSNLGNGTAYQTNVTVSAPPVLNLRGNSTAIIGSLRPFETRYLHFTVNASSAGASCINATATYNCCNGTVRVLTSNYTVNVAERTYDSIIACNALPEYAEISKEVSLDYVMLPIRNTSISVSLVRPDGSIFLKANSSIGHGSFKVRFAPDAAGNWTVSLEVPETGAYKAAVMNTTLPVHPTDLYSSRILSSENKRLVASYDVKEVFTFINNGTETEWSPIFNVSLYVTLPTQDVTLLYIDPLPIALSYDYSSLRARFSPPELGPGENFTIVACFNVKLLALPPVTDDFNGTLGDIPADFLKYTGYAKYWEMNDTSIQGLSSSLTANQTTVLGKVKAIYSWVADNIEYDYDKLHALERHEPAKLNTAPETLALRRGVCADISNLFIALCRASGIPAVGIGGNCYDGENGSESKMGHGWSAAYIPGYGWIEVDATWKLFGRLDDVHVSRSSGRETTEAGGYYWWNVNNATVYEDRLYMTRLPAPSQPYTTVPSNGTIITDDDDYRSVNELDEGAWIVVAMMVAMGAAIIAAPFIISKRRKSGGKGKVCP